MMNIQKRVLILITLIIFCVSIFSILEIPSVHAYNKTIKYAVIFSNSVGDCAPNHYEALAFFASIANQYIQKYDLQPQLAQTSCVSEKDLPTAVSQAQGDDLVIIVLDAIQSAQKEYQTDAAGHYIFNGYTNVIVATSLSLDPEDPFSGWTLSHELSHFILNYEGYPSSIWVDWVHKVEFAKRNCQIADPSLLTCPTLWSTITAPNGKIYDVMAMYSPAIQQQSSSSQGYQQPPAQQQPTSKESDKITSLTTNKSAYADGEWIVINGKTNFYYPNSYIHIVIHDPYGNTVASIQALNNLDTDNTFSGQIHATGWANSGTYQVIATYGTTGWDSETFSFTANSNPTYVQPQNNPQLSNGISVNMPQIVLTPERHVVVMTVLGLVSNNLNGMVETVIKNQDGNVVDDRFTSLANDNTFHSKIAITQRYSTGTYYVSATYGNSYLGSTSFQVINQISTSPSVQSTTSVQATASSGYVTMKNSNYDLPKPNTALLVDVIGHVNSASTGQVKITWGEENKPEGASTTVDISSNGDFTYSINLWPVHVGKYQVKAYYGLGSSMDDPNSMIGKTIFTVNPPNQQSSDDNQQSSNNNTDKNKGKFCFLFWCW